MARFINFPVGKARAEAVGVVEAVEVHLRLGMVVGRIGGPFPRIIQHLAQHHVGKGGVVVVKKCLDLPLHTAHQFTVGARVLGLDRLRGIHHRRVVPLVEGLLDVQLAVPMGGQLHPRPPGGQQAVRLMAEAVGPFGLHRLSVPPVGHLPGEQQHGNFLQRLLKNKGIPVLHHQKAHIHLGPHVVRRGVDIGVVSLFQLRVFVKVGHPNQLLI